MPSRRALHVTCLRLGLPLVVLAWVLGLGGASALAGEEAGYLSTVLDNGLRVSILPDPQSPLVATQVVYHVGSIDEDEATLGFAHLFEHLMFGDTQNHKKIEYESHIHDHGGSNNATTRPDETVYFSEIAPEYHEKVLELEADRMANLLLTQRNLDNEKRIVTEEQRLRFENNAIVRIGIAAMRALLRGHPYAHIGTEQSIAHATLDNARRFYARYYRPDNAHLIIVGPVDGPRVLAQVRRYFGAIEKAPWVGPARKDAPPLLGWSFPAEVEFAQDILPGEGAGLVYALPPASSPDTFALLVLRQLLTQGRINPLHEDLVKRRRVAVEATVLLELLRRGGGIGFFSGSLPYRRKATAFRYLEEARDRIGKLDWLTPQALSAARRALLKKELFRRYSAMDQAEDISRAAYWAGDERLAFSRAARFQAVSAADVRAVWQRYIAGRKPIRVFARPERVPWWITLFGWLYPLVIR